MAKTLRRLWLPLLLTVLGIVCLVFALLSATVWKPADSETVTLPKGATSQLVITRPGVINLYSSDMRVDLEGPRDAFVGIGRATDVASWADGLEHTRIDGIDLNHVFLTSKVKGDGESKLTTPASSDMWVKKATASGKKATLTWNADEEGQYSVIAYSPKGAPQLSLTWKTQATTPWVWPLVIAGIVLIAAAVLLGMLLSRRSRGTGERVEDVEANGANERDAVWAAADAEERDAYAPEAAREETWDDRGDGYADYDEDGYYEEDYALASASNTGYDDGYAEDDETYSEDSYGDGYAGEYYEEDYAPTYGDEGEIYDGYEDARDGYEDTADNGWDEAQQWEDEKNSDGVWPAEEEWRAEWPPIDDEPREPATAMPTSPTHLPPRRSLREARNRGEATIEFEGSTYSTGLIPVIRDGVMPVNDSDEGASADEFGGESAFGEEPRR